MISSWTLPWLIESPGISQDRPSALFSVIANESRRRSSWLIIRSVSGSIRDQPVQRCWENTAVQVIRRRKIKLHNKNVFILCDTCSGPSWRQTIAMLMMRCVLQRMISSWLTSAVKLPNDGTVQRRRNFRFIVYLSIERRTMFVSHPDEQHHLETFGVDVQRRFVQLLRRRVQ